MAKKPVDRATVDLVRAGVSAHHTHRWIKTLQRSLDAAEPDWAAYRNALAYLTLTEKHLTDWLAVASEEHPEARKAKPRKVAARAPSRPRRPAARQRRATS